MQCYVYKSQRSEGAYVYLPKEGAFERLPSVLQERLGNLAFVIELDLSPERKLAREDVNAVMTNLATQGFHLQLPPISDGRNALPL